MYVEIIYHLIGNIYWQYITAVQKFKISKIFNVFLKKRGFLCLLRLYLFDQKYRKNCNIVKYYCNF